MEVIEVRTRSEMRRFVRFPAKLYRDDPLWVPPLWHDERKAYRPAANPILAKSEHVLLMVNDHDTCVGRAVAYIDPAYNACFQTKTGLFGSFESVPDQRVATLLMDKAESWLEERGMERFLGPFHPVAESWGVLLSGNGSPPVFMTPHTPDYYPLFFETLGYRKAKDLLAYDVNADGEYDIPERIERFIGILRSRRPELRVRPISRSTMGSDAEHIWRLSNIALAGNWGYVPLEREIMHDMIKRLRPIMDPDAIWFVEDRGTPVGYCLGFPDLNVVLRETGGRLLPFGFLRLLAAKRTVTDYRLFGLAVHPEYHGLGIDVLLYHSLFNALKPRGIRLEANYILEDNFSIRNALEKLEMSLIKSYRIYEKERR